MYRRSVKISWQLIKTLKTRSEDSTWQSSITWIKALKRRKKSEIICLNPGLIITSFSSMKTLKSVRWRKWRHIGIRLLKYQLLTLTIKINLELWLQINTNKLMLIWPQFKILRKRRQKCKAMKCWGLILYLVKKIKVKSIMKWSLKKIVWSSTEMTMINSSMNHALMSIQMFLIKTLTNTPKNRTHETLTLREVRMKRIR